MQRAGVEVGVRQLDWGSVVEEGAVSGDLHSGSRVCQGDAHSPDTLSPCLPHHRHRSYRPDTDL